MPSARPWVCFAVKNEIPPRQIPIARSTDKPRIVLTTNNGTSAKAKCNRTPRDMTPNTKLIVTANTETAILDAARPKMYTYYEIGEMYTYRIVWYHSRSDSITWNVALSTDATKLK